MKIPFTRIAPGHYRHLGENFDAHVWKSPKGLGVWSWAIFRVGSKPMPLMLDSGRGGRTRGVAYSLEFAKFDVRESLAGRRVVYS
jgi:hypothetical protein